MDLSALAESVPSTAPAPPSADASTDSVVAPPDAEGSPSLTPEQRARRAARNRKWREIHKDQIRAKRAEKREGLKQDPEKLAAKLAKDRDIRKARMQDPATRARIAATRRAWRARTKPAVAPASTPQPAAQDAAPPPPPVDDAASPSLLVA